MQVKCLEIRDKGTFIAALAVDMNPGMIGGSDPDTWTNRRYLLRRCGYACDGEPNIILARLDGGGQATNDPYEWGDRTWSVAHKHIIEHWAELKDGDVVCVEHILGERAEPNVSERITDPV